MKEHENLQTLQRGLQALAFLNRNGPTSVTELAKQLTVSRPTAYRLLETLATEGYSSRIPGTRKYRVMPAVRRLSQAINDDDMLTAVALDPIFKLGAEIKWPLTLVTPSGTSMLVRITTDHSSPFALSRIPPGTLVPMINTTTGLLYLALADQKNRVKLLKSIAIAKEGDYEKSDEDNLETLLATSARNKYLILERPWFREGNLGVPIMNGKHPIGGIAMRYIKSAMRREDLIDQYLPKLTQLTEEIFSKYEKYKSDILIGFELRSSSLPRFF